MANNEIYLDILPYIAIYIDKYHITPVGIENLQIESQNLL